jgi:hypothetical protein
MWVQIKDGGWINLDLVGQMQRMRDGDWHLRSLDGIGLGVVPGHPDLDVIVGDMVVPATVGQEAISFLMQTDDDEGPEIIVSRKAVVAWRISQEAALPIVAGDSPASNETVMVLQPDGRVCDPFNQEWPSIEAAKAGMLKEARLAWERLRAGIAVDADR